MAKMGDEMDTEQRHADAGRAIIEQAAQRLGVKLAQTRDRLIAEGANVHGTLGYQTPEVAPTPKRQRYTRLSPAMQTAMAHAAKHGGIVDHWEIKTGTSVALIDRSILTTIHTCLDGVKRQQLTNGGLNVATPRIDLDKLHEAALDEDDERSGGYGQPDGLLGATEARQQEHTAAGLPGVCDPDVDHDHDPATPGSLTAEVLDDEARNARVAEPNGLAMNPNPLSLIDLVKAYCNTPHDARPDDLLHQITMRLSRIQGVAEGLAIVGFQQSSTHILDQLNGTEH